MRFLLHLEDCRKAGYDGVEHGLQVIQTISVWIQRYQLPSSEIGDKLKRLSKDLEYLILQLSKLGTTIREDKETLRQHFQLTQDQTLFRLTILAAIFLPLSFATSFFGMNIDGLPQEVQMLFSRKPGDGPQKDEDKPEFLRALDRITDKNISDATVALAAVLGSQDATWTTFAVTAVCLLCTLPVALMAGAIIRGVIVAAAKYVIYWRGLAILGIFIVFFFSTFAKFIPHFFVRGFLIWGFGGLFLLFTLWQTYRAWRRMRQPFFWTFLLVLTVACFVLEFLFGFGLWFFPFMVTPWSFLGLWYMIPWWMRRRHQV